MRSPYCLYMSSCAFKRQASNQLTFTTFRMNMMLAEGTSQKGTASSSRRPSIWAIIAVYSTNTRNTYTNWKLAEYSSAKPGGPYTITINYKSNDVEVRLSLCMPCRKWNGVIAPHVINLGTKCGYVVNFMSWPLYFREKSRCMLWSPAGNGTTISWISCP